MDRGLPPYWYLPWDLDLDPFDITQWIPPEMTVYAIADAEHEEDYYTDPVPSQRMRKIGIKPLNGPLEFHEVTESEYISILWGNGFYDPKPPTPAITLAQMAAAIEQLWGDRILSNR